jgi:hypothetical protein
VVKVALGPPPEKDMQRFHRAVVIGLALGVALSSGCLAAANPLLGTWVAEDLGAHRNSDGVDYCEANPKFIFTATTEIMFGPASPGQAPPQGKNDVKYLVSGKTIYVSASDSFLDAPKYTMLNANEMQAGQIGNCRYKRQ